MKNRFPILCVIFAVLIGLSTGCAKKADDHADHAGHDHDHAHGHSHDHEHIPPHGGTAVVLGDELYHVEFVLDAATGKLQAYLLDGELENFVRTAQPSFEVVATLKGAPHSLLFQAVANSATGETAGDTALFEVQADWLRNTSEFEATLKSIILRGTTFTDVHFNFPKGNDSH